MIDTVDFSRDDNDPFSSYREEPKQKRDLDREPLVFNATSGEYVRGLRLRLALNYRLQSLDSELIARSSIKEKPPN